MTQKTIGMIAVVAVVAGGLGFYGGMQYGVSNTQSGVQTALQGGRGQGGGGFGGRGAGFAGGNGGFGGGEVIAKDDKSITVQLPTSGSKIIFFSDTTRVMKAVQGSLADVVVGTQISANGTANADGSMTADSIQIRPASSTRGRQ